MMNESGAMSRTTQSTRIDRRKIVTEKDYSATPLWKKLGIKEGASVALVGAPRGFARVLGPLPAGARLTGARDQGLDVIVAFETAEAGMSKRFAELARVLDSAGGLWIAYPKPASGVETDLTFEKIQHTGLRSGLVDNKS